MRLSKSSQCSNQFSNYSSEICFSHKKFTKKKIGRQTKEQVCKFVADISIKDSKVAKPLKTDYQKTNKKVVIRSCLLFPSCRITKRAFKTSSKFSLLFIKLNASKKKKILKQQRKTYKTKKSME